MMKNERCFEYWLLEWLDYKHAIVKNSTYMKYRNSINKHIIPNLGLFNIEDLEANLNNNLSTHVVEKKIECLDEDGNVVKPEKENGYKFETLVLDMVHMMDNCLSFEVERNKEFAPIKNPTGVDSVESARALLKENGIEF